MSDNGSFGGYLKGLFIGGLIGGIAALLWAPRSGQKTRALLRRKADEANAALDKSVQVAREQLKGVRAEGQRFAKTVRQSGQTVADEAKRNVKEVVEAADDEGVSETPAA